MCFFVIDFAGPSERTLAIIAWRPRHGTQGPVNFRSFCSSREGQVR